MSEILLEARNLTKVFGALRANDDVHLKIKKGSIHGIVGENGAGKSTLLKMLFGIYQPTSGEIRFRNQLVQWKNPRTAIENGIGMVQQHFSLVESLTALDNIILGSEPTRGPIGRLLRDEARARLEKLIPSPHLRVPWDTQVEELSVGFRQRIEILKLLYRDCDVLILDEPTAVLTPQEIDDFFEVLRELKSHGKTILIITHKLREIFTICDEVTVMRSGKTVGSGEIKNLTQEKLIEWMVGRNVRAPQRSITQTLGNKLIVAQGVAERKAERGQLKGINLEVSAGEIVGIAGVEGSGQRHFLECLLGLRNYDGKISVLDLDPSVHGTAKIRGSGVGLIPEERMGEGLWGTESILNNLVVGLEDQFLKLGFFQRQTIQQKGAEWTKEFDLRAQSLEMSSKFLSGGNQQKVIFAREVSGRKPRLLICFQPTRGVDIGAIELIHHRIVELRNQGVGVLVMSSELDELITLCDRMYVFFDGTSPKCLQRSEFEPRAIGAAMTGSL